MEHAREGSRWRWEPRWSRLGRELSAMGGEAGVSARFEAPSPADERRLAELRKPLLGVAVTLVVALMAAMALWRATGAALGALQATPAAHQASPAATRQTQPPTPTAGSTAVVVIPIVAATATSPPATSTPAVRAETPAPTVAPTTVLTAVPTRAPAAPVPSATPATVQETTTRVHVVERGDTLFSIARRNGTTVGALVTANGLGSAETPLSTGRRLVIP